MLEYRLYGFFIGAVTLVQDEEERQRWAIEFKDSGFASIAREPAPINMTTTRALASVKACEDDPREPIRKEQTYDKRNVFRKHFPHYEYVEATVNGPAHIIYNLVQDLMSLVTNEKGQMEWTDKQRTVENNLGRFIGFTIIHINLYTECI
jgi:hypothetical protein